MDKAGAKWAQIRAEKRRSFEFASEDLHAVSLLTRWRIFCSFNFHEKEKSELFQLNYKVKVREFMKKKLCRNCAESLKFKQDGRMFNAAFTKVGSFEQAVTQFHL